MAIIRGEKGDVIFPGQYRTHVKSWTLDIVADALDTTSFSTTQARSFIPGLKSWSGSFVCNLDDTTPVDDAGNDPTIIYFYIGPQMWFEGDAFITGVHPGVVVDGIGEVTVDIQGTGALSMEVPMVSPTPTPTPTPTAS